MKESSRVPRSPFLFLFFFFFLLSAGQRGLAPKVKNAEDARALLRKLLLLLLLPAQS